MKATKSTNAKLKKNKTSKKTDEKLKSIYSEFLGNLDIKQQKFVIGYMSGNSLQKSMIEAGYTKSYASDHAADVRWNPKVNEAIEAIRNKYLLPKLNEALNKSLEIMITALNQDPEDFYDVDVYTDDKGDTHEYQKLKLLRDLTPEQRSIINSVDYKGTKGIADYDKIGKQEAIKTIMQIKKDLEARIDKEKERNSSQDVETEITLEGIKDKCTAKIKVINKKNEQSDAAGQYKDEPEEITEEL